MNTYTISPEFFRELGERLCDIEDRLLYVDFEFKSMEKFLDAHAKEFARKNGLNCVQVLIDMKRAMDEYRALDTTATKTGAI